MHTGRKGRIIIVESDDDASNDAKENESHELPATKNGAAKKSHVKKSKMKRSPLNLHNNTVIAEESYPIVCSSPNYSSSSEDVPEDTLWIDKYAPSSSLDLAVHKKKVDQVRLWLLDVNASPLLLLTGPSGSGKTCTVRTLCKDLQIHLLEWDDVDDISHFSKNVDSFSKNSFRVALLRDSVSKAAAFPLLEFSKVDVLSPILPDGASPSSLSSASPKTPFKVILLENFPVHTPSYRKSFATLIENFAQTAIYKASMKQPLTTRIIVILSDGLMSSQAELKELLPQALLAQRRIIQHVKFNPVASTIMQKCLNRIMEWHLLSHKKFKKAHSQFLNDLIEMCHGDIRSSICHLQFLFSDTIPSSQSLGMYGRSSGKSLFRLLGHILYKKGNLGSMSTFAETLEQSGVESSLMAVYLHEHYMSFFMEDEDIDELACIAELLSASSAIVDQVPYYKETPITAYMHLLPAEAFQLRAMQGNPFVTRHANEDERLYALSKPALFESGTRCKDNWSQYKQEWWEDQEACLGDMQERPACFGLDVLLDTQSYLSSRRFAS